MATKHQKAGMQEQIAENRLRALQLRRAGASYRAIGKALNVTYQTAFNYVQAVMAEMRALTESEREDYRTMELDRCDAMQAAAWQKAVTGDLKAINTVLAVMERRARYLPGLEASRIELTGAEGAPLVDVDAIRARLADAIARAAKSELAK
jgi:hypothetical protein